MGVAPRRVATTRGVDDTPDGPDDGVKITWNWLTPAREDWRYTSADEPGASATVEMLGRLGSSGCPRLGDTACPTTVTAVINTTGTATERTNPRPPRITAGGRMRSMPERPRRARRRLLSTTIKLENPMATAATNGSKSPAAARGNADRLYPMAQPKFWTMMAEVEAAIPTAAGTPSRSLPSRAT